MRDANIYMDDVHIVDKAVQDTIKETSDLVADETK